MRLGLSTVTCLVLAWGASLPARVPAAESAVSPASASGPALESILASRPRHDESLSLERAVAVALKESPVIRGAALEVEAALGRVAAARAERRPWLSANTFMGGGSASNIVTSPDPVQPRMSMLYPGDFFFDQNVSLMVPLFTGGRLRAMVRQADALRGASQAELEAMRQEVGLMVRVAYREAQARRSFLAVNRAMLAQNKERQRIDLISFDQQRIPRFYILRNEAEVANAEQMLADSERQYEIGLIELRTLMGIHLESRIELSELPGFRTSGAVLEELTGAPARPLAPVDPPATRPDLTDLSRLLRMAERNRPELSAAGFRVQAGREEVNAARSAFKPQVSAGIMGDVMKMKGESPFVGTTFALVASFPILDGGLRRARLQSSRAEQERAIQDRVRVALQIGQEVATALASLRTAERNVDTARSGVVAAEEDYRVALLRYTSGFGINLEALDALAAQVRAQSNQIRAMFEYDVAQDRLARAVGRTPGVVPLPVPAVWAGKGERPR